jgi:Protein of unknown function (DUF1631)
MEQTSASILPVALASAAQCVKSAVREAAERTVDTFASAVLSSRGSYGRGRLSAAQFALTHHLPELLASFEARLDEALRADQGRRSLEATTTQAAALDWASLSLVDEAITERTVTADRIGNDIAQSCQEILNSLDTYVAGMLQLEALEPNRNPLRPAAIVGALLPGLETCGDDAETRELIRNELSSHLGNTLKRAYGQVVEVMQRAGVAPFEVVYRAIERNTVSASLGARRLTSDPISPSGSRQYAEGDRASGGGYRTGGAPSFATSTSRGRLEAPLGSLIRGLATHGHTGVGGPFTESDEGSELPPLVNLIDQHRDALRQASTASADHLIIDVVAILFDQILEDPRLPAAMARQIARLQLPVLRAALDDSSFFSSRRHPVRRFVNRLASLGAGLEDLSADSERSLLARVAELVGEIVDGDFERLAGFEQKLGALEAFVAEQARQEVQAAGGAASLVAEREQDLRQHQLFAEQLKQGLTGLPVPEFLIDFIGDVWTQVLLTALRNDTKTGTGEEPTLARNAARDLLLSALPKGALEHRRRFLNGLPSLMKQLNEGIALAQWPEAAKADFFGKLLPAHAESLRGAVLSTLDFNLLLRRIETALATPPPNAQTTPSGALLVVAAAPVETSDTSFNPQEAQQIGLVTEQAVDWSAEIDINLDAEPEVQASDLAVQGLPSPETLEPVSGSTLIDHLQVGFAYRMHLKDKWQKVRLNYISPARTFFVFTHGRGQREAVSLTQRMALRLAACGRLRAFENAYLLERATARARRQLAELSQANPD